MKVAIRATMMKIGIHDDEGETPVGRAYDY